MNGGAQKNQGATGRERDEEADLRARGQRRLSTLQRLNGLMAAKCCDLGTQGRFKAVPGTHKLL